MSSGDILGVPTSSDDVGEGRDFGEHGREGRGAVPSESLQESLGQAWRALSNLASTVATKSAAKVRAATEELGHLIGEAKVEVADIYHENLEDSINQMASAIPALFSNSSNGPKNGANGSTEEIRVENLDKSYEACRRFLLDAPGHDQWQAFRESDVSIKTKFGDVQKRIILSNDIGLNQLYADLCPKEMEPEVFWERWRFWKKLQREGASRVASGEGWCSSKSAISEEDWEDWE